MEQHKVTVSFGSNCGDRERNVANAIEWCSSIAQSIISSTIYETPSIHGGPKKYMNAVGKLTVDLSYTDLEKETKLYEMLNGRTQECRDRGDVPIDIDIVVWDDEIKRPEDFKRSFFTLGYNQL